MTAGPMIRLPSCDTVSDLYVRSCQWKGRQILFEDDRGVAFSGDDALNRSLRFASALDAMGVAAGEVVAFLCLGSATHAVAWFGTVSGGRVACNLHVRGETAERIADTLKWLDARVVVCEYAVHQRRPSIQVTERVTCGGNADQRRLAGSFQGSSAS